ncbi:MAG: type IX secretion system protein PorQ [bacterium]|nr:type IX secretion system protein PorQ [bacterium]
MRRHSVIKSLKKGSIFIIIFLSLNGMSQVGGTKTFRFLDIPMTARAAANGGSSMSIWGDDINLIHSNPALLNPDMLKQAAFNYCNYVGNINYYSLAYAHSLKHYGTAAITMQAFNYGKFYGYDELGSKTRDFYANDYSINLHYAKPLADSMFTVGVALKTIISQYDSYKSFGNALDFGVTYHSKKDFTASLLARNVGYMWKNYSNITNEKESLPSTVQLGLSKKLAKAPFRVFVVYDQLLKWNLRYISPIDTAGKNSSFSNTPTADSTSWQKFTVKAGHTADNFMRHVVLGTEILITKNFSLRVAYNYRRQVEMTLPERRGANAFSFGIGFKVKRFAFACTYTKMAFPGNSLMMGLTFVW